MFMEALLILRISLYLGTTWLPEKKYSDYICKDSRFNGHHIDFHTSINCKILYDLLL